MSKEICLLNNWSIYYKTPGECWPDFKGQDVIIYDELNINNVNLSFFNMLINGQYSTVPIKGGHINFTSHVIFLISNYSFDTLFKRHIEEIKFTLTRRIDYNAIFDRNSDKNIFCDFSEYDTEIYPKALIRNLKLKYSVDDLVKGDLQNITENLFTDRLQLKSNNINKNKDELTNLILIDKNICKEMIDNDRTKELDSPPNTLCILKEKDTANEFNHMGDLNNHKILNKIVYNVVDLLNTDKIICLGNDNKY